MNERLAALEFVTRALRNDGQTKAVNTLRAEIRTAQPPWEAVVSLANKHLLTPALWVALSDKGLASELPEDLRDYLRELHQLSRERNRHLRIQLLEAARQLNSVGIVPILLKGAKHLVTEIYTDPGVRIMTDIDLLVRREEINPSLDVLRQIDYEPIEDVHDDYHDEHHHCAPLFRPGDYATLEIHRSLTERRYEPILPTAMAAAEAQSLEVEGCLMKTLSPTHRILHNIIHSQLVDMHHVNGIIPLRSMHEVTTENAENAGATHWQTIRSRLSRHNRARELQAYLYIAKQLFGLDFKADIGNKAMTRYYYQRCRMQVRWRWVDRWGLRFGRYSSDMLQRKYGCGNNRMAVYLARLRQFKERAWNL